MTTERAGHGRGTAGESQAEPETRAHPARRLKSVHILAACFSASL